MFESLIIWEVLRVIPPAGGSLAFQSLKMFFAAHLCERVNIQRIINNEQNHSIHQVAELTW